MFIDYIVRVVSGMGHHVYLPIVKVEEKEIYRGEYKRSFDEAMAAAEEAGYNYSMQNRK